MSPLWRVRILITFLAILAIGMGYLYFTKRISPEERALLAEQQPPETTVTPTPDTTLVNFAQLLAVPYDLDQSPSASSGAMLDFIGDNKPGFVTIFGSQIASSSASEVITEIFNETVPQERPLIAVDHEGGRVQRLNGLGFTKLPTWRRVCGQTADVRQAELASSAAELHVVGISIVFAPVVDVSDSNAILKDRTCSGDPALVSDAALDYIAAFQQENILPVIKHYPGLGNALLDTHDDFVTTTITEKDIAPFKTILDTYPTIGVMTAHIGVENQSAVLPCSLSSGCVGQLFELYPEVAVFSDALDMKGASYNSINPDKPKTLETVTIEAINAGTTVLVYGQDVTAADLESVLSRIKVEYTSSSDFRTKVNVAVEKIVTLKKQYSPVPAEDDESAG
jgi:beta-N-acetylhexosaminidase